VDEAMDAPLALEKIYRAYEAGIPFQAVLLDMQMPGMDGGSLARVIRSDRNLKDISLIMLSSQGRNPDSWSRYKELFNAHLAKPVMQDQLCQTLACVLNMGTKAENIQFNVKDKDCTTLHRSGLKVLLVEDNIVNQKVAQSMLQKLGICPDIANNGAEAVKMLKDNFYDLVFMDVQMPVMDGLEATRLIRDPVSDVLDHDITIIAMTAHAMKGDKERCYEAGMDDYVSKPVSLKTLAELVGRWSGTIHKKDDAHQGYPAQPEEAMCPDRVIFDRQAFMERIMDDPDLARYLISVFQKDMPQMLQVLKESVEKEQIEDLRHYAHKVKGSSASVGGMALSSIAAEMERIDETEGVKKAGQLMEEIEKQYDLLVLSLKDLIEE
jgi:CheY-like chemotaxis protein